MSVWLLSVLYACSGGGVDTGWSTADAGENVVIEVGEVALFDGTRSVGESFSWDFGDGESAEGALAEHTFAQAGNYTAVISALGEDGSVSTDTIKVTAYRSPLQVRESHSSTIAVHRASQTIWVVNPEADTVSVLSPSGDLLSEMDSCSHPRTLAIQDDTVAVACEFDDSIQLIDVNTAMTIDLVELPEGSSPFGVAGNNGGWWVTMQGLSSVAHIVGDTIESFYVGPDPRGVSVSGDGRVFVSRWRSTDDAGIVYEIYGDDLILAYDFTPDSDTTTRGVPTLIESPVASPDGGRLYVPGHQGNTARGLYRDGQALTFETTVRAILRGVDLESNTEDPDLSKHLDDRGRTGAIELSPLGNLAYLLHPGTETVTVIDAYTAATAGSMHSVGAAPMGLALSPDGETLYIQAWLDRRVNAYDVSSLSPPPALMWSTRTVSEEPLADDVLLGKIVFYNSSDPRMAESGYLTCAHCHPDGRDDGLVWDFTDRGEGLRNTTSLLPLGQLNPGAFHWTGNFDELQDFENDIRGGFGGLGFLSDEQWESTSETLGEPKAGLSLELDALAAYVLSLEPPESPFEAPLEGEQAFVEAGCAVCHPGPTFTDSQLNPVVRHDIGTITTGSGQRLGVELDGFDTPTLLGVFQSAPYLHDGSAVTINEAIMAHDGADQISESDLDLIVGYLLSL
jgi:DNA-binding beta-propeller fold protein YncE